MTADDPRGLVALRADAQNVIDRWNDEYSRDVPPLLGKALGRLSLTLRDLPHGPVADPRVSAEALAGTIEAEARQLYEPGAVAWRDGVEWVLRRVRESGL